MLSFLRCREVFVIFRTRSQAYSFAPLFPVFDLRLGNLPAKCLIYFALMGLLSCDSLRFFAIGELGARTP